MYYNIYNNSLYKIDIGKRFKDITRIYITVKPFKNTIIHNKN